MNILFYRYGSICEPDMMEAFETLGHTIIPITLEITDKSVSHTKSIETIRDTLFKQPCSLIFTINYYPFLSEVCMIFKIPYVCLIVDSPVFELYSDTIANECNRIFLFDKMLYEEFSPFHPDGIFYLPLAGSPARTKKVLSTITTKERTDYAHDISFIGSLYSEKCPFNQLVLSDYLRGYSLGVIETQLKVYGYNFIKETITDEVEARFLEECPQIDLFPERARKDYKAVIAHLLLGMKVTEQERIRIMKQLSLAFSVSLYTGSDTSDLPNVHNKGFAETLTQMPKIFHLSHINLNMTCKAIQTGIPLRVFDILSCEGFLLSNYQAELPEYFTIGEDLDTYGSIEELEEKCHYYMERPKLCREIAHNGFLKVSQNHTWIQRAETILSCL